MVQVPEISGGVLGTKRGLSILRLRKHWGRGGFREGRSREDRVPPKDVSWRGHGCCTQKLTVALATCTKCGPSTSQHGLGKNK